MGCWLVWGLLAGVGVYALHRLALFLESRGWLFYVNRRPQVSLGAAVGAALDPATRRMLEAKQQEHRLEEDESGDGSRASNRDPRLRFPPSER